MERLFFRERQSDIPAPAQQLHIAVTGLGRSVGTTFVATALAFYFRDAGKETTYCQCLTPSKATRLLYDEIAMEQRFARRLFCDVYGKIEAAEPVKMVKSTKRLNEEEGISWILPTPQSEDLGESQMSRLLTIPKEEVCVFDFEAEPQWNQFLMDMDLLVVVVDPLPSRLIHSKTRFAFLKKLELSGCNVVWVVNRDNPGVNPRQLKSYLKTNQIIRVPSFPMENIYQCEYSCKFPWENEEIHRKMLEIYTLLFQNLSKYSIIL